MTEKEDHGAPDAVKPESPWRWQQVESDDFTLIGPLGEDLLCAGAESAYGEGWCNGSVSPSPAVRELIRLAPEMEAALRGIERKGTLPDFSGGTDCCPECEGEPSWSKETGYGSIVHDNDCSIGRILAALDSARDVKP